MFIGKMSITGILDGSIFVRIDGSDSSYTAVIRKGDNIIALIDPTYNFDNDKPTLKEFSYDEIMKNIDQTDENNAQFKDDLRHIHGISLI